MSETEWSDRPALARHGLAPIAFLLGEWEGTGTADGQPMRGHLTVRSILDGTFFEASETLYSADGSVDWEDRVFYRYALEDHTIRALHLQAPAWMADRYVNVRTDCEGLTWSGGPTMPRVRIVHEQGRLEVQVFQPGESAPHAHMVYRPRS
jgi:hypothetical protein